MIFNSTNNCSGNASIYEGLFSHDRGTGQTIIKDALINNATIAEARAISELLSGGYVEKIVTISSIHIQGLKQNDIVTFKGVNWIVKEISFVFNPPKLIQQIKGVRYE